MIDPVDATTFAVLALVFFGPAMTLEWNGPSHGSSYVLRRTLWLAGFVCIAFSLVLIAYRWTS